jgi:hypothetical protein
VARVSSNEISADNKGGFKRDDIHRVIAISVAKDAFAVLPEIELKPGEYVLVFGNPSAAYDFGVSPAKR